MQTKESTSKISTKDIRTPPRRLVDALQMCVYCLFQPRMFIRLARGSSEAPSNTRFRDSSLSGVL